MSVDTSHQGEVQELRPYERFAHSLQSRAEIDDDGGQELTATSIDKILTAESADDVWDADEAGLIALKDLAGAEIEFRTLKVRKSSDPEKDNLFHAYVICECVMLAEFRELGLTVGEVVQVNTGVETVIAKLRKFESMGEPYWPCQALVTARKAGKGDMIRLRPIPRRAVTGSAEG